MLEWLPSVASYLWLALTLKMPLCPPHAENLILASGNLISAPKLQSNA